MLLAVEVCVAKCGPMGYLLVALVVEAGKDITHAARREEVDVCHVLSLFEDVLLFFNVNSLENCGDPLNE